jgi:hypothetical protein
MYAPVTAAKHSLQVIEKIVINAYNKVLTSTILARTSHPLSRDLVSGVSHAVTRARMSNERTIEEKLMGYRHQWIQRGSTDYENLGSERQGSRVRRTCFHCGSRVPMDS